MDWYDLEQRRKYWHEYRENHKEETREKKIEYYRRNKERILELRRKKGVSIKCSECGKETRKVYSQLRRNKTGLFFCSNICLGKYFKENNLLKGKRTSNWNGGPEEASKRRKEYVKIHREEIAKRERDAWLKRKTNIDPSYVSKLISHKLWLMGSKVNRKNIPSDLVESYRQLLLLKREIKSLKEAANGIQGNGT
jgi:bacterioferritin-associated ferredoxin